MGSVGPNSHRPGDVLITALLPATSHSAGAETASVNRALRSGWSKQPKIR